MSNSTKNFLWVPTHSDFNIFGASLKNKNTAPSFLALVLRFPKKYVKAL
jgi:hypothetical protein